MEKNKEKKIVTVKKGVYKIPDNNGDGYLIGSKCKNCGEYFYPQRNKCLNCYSENLEETALSKEGKVFYYARCWHAYPYSLVSIPYINACVELPEKVYVPTLITGIEHEDLKVGMDMELHFFTIKEDDEQKVIAFAFKPK